MRIFSRINTDVFIQEWFCRASAVEWVDVSPRGRRSKEADTRGDKEGCKEGIKVVV